MGFFDKKSTKESNQKVIEYRDKFYAYIDSLNDENSLNKIFTEITILRMKLDGFDSFLGNLKDTLKRKNSIEKVSLIKLQFEDIIETSKFKKYSDAEYKEIDRVMNLILTQKNKNAWSEFWDWVMAQFDKAIGKK